MLSCLHASLLTVVNLSCTEHRYASQNKSDNYSLGVLLQSLNEFCSEKEKDLRPFP